MGIFGFKARPGAHSSKQSGDAFEDRALRHLQQAGLRLVTRNYRTPGRGGGEIDLIMREPDGTLVFVEVRAQWCQPWRRGGQHRHRSSGGGSCLPRAIT